jgi:hypothetical protein
MNEEEKSKTGCVCPLSGFCSKHQVNKTPHLHRLCQNHSGYFDMWENCKGPGQHNVDCKEIKEEEDIKSKLASKQTVIENPEDKKLPSLVQQAKNLSSALANHITSGFTNVSPEIQQSRLAMCYSCPHYLKESNRCAKCGCNLSAKTKMATSKCPIGKW